MLKQKKIYLFPLVLFISFICADFNFAQIRIAVLYSDLTANHLIENPKKVVEDITAWELFLMQNKIPYEVIYDSDLESGIEDEFDILILPSVEVISKKEFDELQNFLAAGKSIISVGSKLYDSVNQRESFDNIKSLFKLNNPGFIDTKISSFNHSIIPNHLNHFIDSSVKTIQITNKNNLIECNSISGINNSYGFILGNNFEVNSKSSMVYGSQGNAKYFWSGFGLNDVIGGKSDIVSFKKIILEAISWMDSEPDVYIKYSFDNGNYPALLTLQYNNALQPELIQVLIKNDFPPYLILDPQIKFSKEIVDQFLAEKIILDLRSMQSNEFTDTSLANIIYRFEQENNITVHSILLENLDTSVDLTAIKQNSVKNIFYYSDKIKSPEFDNDGFFVIPFNAQSTHLINSGSIYFFNYVAKNNCDDADDNMLINSLKSFDDKKVMFTSLEDIRSWWEYKNNLEVKFLSNVDSKIKFRVDNRNFVILKDFQIFFNPGNIFENDNIAITSYNIPVNYYKDSNGALIIDIDNINPNSNKVFIVRYDQK